MTTELVTAHAGTNHVDSEDIGALYAGALGSGRYVLDVGEGMAVSMSDANTLRIGTGGFVFDGRWVRVTDAEEVRVQSGYQAAYRKDLVTYTYMRDPSSGNVETGEWGVVMGTAAAKEEDAKLPTVETASILDRDLKVTCSVAEVDIAGLTPTAKLLLPSVRSLKSIGESMSPSKLSYELNVTMNAGNINAYMSGNVVSFSFFCSLSGLPRNDGGVKKIVSGLPAPVGYTLGHIAAQYANPAYIARFYVESDGCLYVENKSDHWEDPDWVVGSITYIAK